MSASFNNNFISAAKRGQLCPAKSISDLARIAFSVALRLVHVPLGRNSRLSREPRSRKRGEITIMMKKWEIRGKTVTARFRRLWKADCEKWKIPQTPGAVSRSRAHPSSRGPFKGVSTRGLPWRWPAQAVIWSQPLCFRRATRVADGADVRGGFVTTRSRLPARRRLQVGFPRVLMSARLFLPLAIPIGMRPLHLIKGTRQPRFASPVRRRATENEKSDCHHSYVTNVGSYKSYESLLEKDSGWPLEHSLETVYFQT